MKLLILEIDVFTASTVILAIILSPNTKDLCPRSVDSLETTWKLAMEILALYEGRGRSFSRRCAWTLQTALEQGLRETKLSPRSSRGVCQKLLVDYAIPYICVVTGDAAKLTILIPTDRTNLAS